MKIFGIPGEVVIVRAVPDTEPVEFNWSATVYASWITEQDKKETES